MGKNYVRWNPGEANGEFPPGTPYHNLVLQAQDLADSWDRNDKVNRISGTSGNRLAPEELLEEARKLYGRDSQRLANTNYTKYSGPTITPMSTLTQRARELEQSTIGRPAPYTDKLTRLAQSNNQAFTPNDIQRILADLQQRHATFGRNVTGAKLTEQFNAPYAPMRDRYQQKLTKDINTRMPEARSGLDITSQAANAAEAERTRHLYETMDTASKNKAQRMNTLIGNLNDMGNQKHAINNMVNQGEQRRFEDERDQPYKNLDMLGRSINGSGAENDHPDLARAGHGNLVQTLRAYGVDPSKPSGEWDSTRSQRKSYPGELVAGINPELQGSYDLIENISPQYKDAGYARRKALQEEMLAPETAGQRALRGLPTHLQAEMDKLEREGSIKAKRDINDLNRKYIRQGTYRSQDHMSAADRRIRELNDATMEQRIKLLNKGLQSSLESQHLSESDKIKQMKILGHEGQKEYMNMLGDISSINNLGATKWKNKQDENNELYKNYQNERSWEWPLLRKNTAQHGINTGIPLGIGAVFNEAQERGISLAELSRRLSQPYSELEKENKRIQREINDHRGYTNQLQDKLRQFNAAEQERQRAVEHNRQRDAQQQQQRLAQQETTRLAEQERQRLANLQQQNKNVYNAMHAPIYGQTTGNAWNTYPGLSLAQQAASIKEQLAAHRRNHGL
jgi:hypothetical protein